MASAGSVTCVEGRWVEPRVSCPPTGDRAVAIWVGIDGFESTAAGVRSSATLEQIGTESGCHAGQQTYFAWSEILPAEPRSRLAQEVLVSPGDSIWARVRFADGRFELTVVDLTSNTAESVSADVSGAARRTAEWVVEAPSGGCPSTCAPLPMPNFGKMTLRSAYATIGSQRAAINDDRWLNDRLTMIRNGILRATTTTLSSGGTSFAVTWVHR